MPVAKGNCNAESTVRIGVIVVRVLIIVRNATDSSADHWRRSYHDLFRATTSKDTANHAGGVIKYVAEDVGSLAKDAGATISSEKACLVLIFSCPQLN